MLRNIKGKYQDVSNTVSNTISPNPNSRNQNPSVETTEDLLDDDNSSIYNDDGSNKDNVIFRNIKGKYQTVSNTVSNTISPRDRDRNISPTQEDSHDENTIFRNIKGKYQNVSNTVSNTISSPRNQAAVGSQDEISNHENNGNGNENTMFRNIKGKYQNVSSTVTNAVSNTVSPKNWGDNHDDDSGRGTTNNNNNGNSQSGEGQGQDLISILDRSERGDLMMLVVNITEVMKGGIEQYFDYKPPVQTQKPGESNTDDGSSDTNRDTPESGKVIGLTEDEAEIERPPSLPPRRGGPGHGPGPSRTSSSVSGSLVKEDEKVRTEVEAGKESPDVRVETGNLIELEPEAEPEPEPEPEPQPQVEYRPRLPLRPRRPPRPLPKPSWAQKSRSTEPGDGGDRPLSEKSAPIERLHSNSSRVSPSTTPPSSTVATSASTSRAKEAALSHFCDWADSVVLRIGNIVNSDEERTEYQDDSLNQDSDDSTKGRGNSLHAVYPPTETPLSQLSQPKRLLILHSLLLLLLSLQHYNAYSRVFMLRLTSSLNLHIKDLNSDETKVARGLLDAVTLSSGADGQAQAQKKDPSRIWKVGLATVAGATLIGVTGGLAAPLVAAGLGTVMGGLGLGATAAAGYLGALAGSGVVVGGLFGAYGGRMTGRMMDKYAREVEDFAFLPIRGREEYENHSGDDDHNRGYRVPRRLPSLPWKPGSARNEKEEAQQDHRLRVTVGITGWVTDENDFTIPWRVIGNDTEKFGLRWELEALLKLGNAMSALVTSAAWGIAGREVLSRTIFAGLMSAVMLPMGLLKVSSVVDNPFSVAKARADKAGRVLADVLINKAQGERPITLVGYSLGSRVIYSCLQTLAKRRAYGLVESAVMMGSPTPSDVEDWRVMRTVVTGRLVNVFSKNDAVLAFLYRTSSLQLGVAGLQPIPAAAGLGIQNVDVSDFISGHLRYQYLLGKVLARIGFVVDIDVREAAREEALLAMRDREEEEEREENERYAGGDANVGKSDSGATADEEEARLKTVVERRTQERLKHRRMEQIRQREMEEEDSSESD